MSNQVTPPKGGKSPSTRQRYRSIMARRQATVYGILIAFLAVMLVIALLGLSGKIPLPFGNDFSTQPDYAETGDLPCPTENAQPTSPAGVDLQVLNASSLSGAAGKLAEMLEAEGYTIALVDNAQEIFKGTIEIGAGREGVDQAYTLARYFDGSVRIRLYDLPGKTLTITIGEGLIDLPTEAEFETGRNDTSVLKALPECKILNPNVATKTQQPTNQSE